MPRVGTTAKPKPKSGQAKRKSDLYNTQKWRRLSRAYRDQHPLCECGCCNPSQVVDHITPHNDDPELFWNQENWQALAKVCHDRKTATEDSLFSISLFPKWVKPSRIPVTMICGAPGSGKSTLARTLANNRTLIIDLDTIKEGIDEPDSGLLFKLAIRERNRMLANLETNRRHSNAIFIVGAPIAGQRLKWQRLLGVKTTFVMTIPADICKQRRPELSEAIDKWHREYTIGQNEKIITYKHQISA